MKARIQKWGNSLALRIPKPFSDEAGLQKETAVEISLVDGKIVITPIITPKLNLNELLAGITEENLHREVDTGAAIGNEAR